MIRTLFIITLVLSLNATAFAKTGAAKKERILAQHSQRVQHAHELLGRHYRRSAVRAGEKVTDINSQVFKWTRERLPKRFKKDHKRIARAIIEQSDIYKLDPVLLISMIQGESSFDPEKIGGVGEIGLMQIRPTTGKWIAAKYGIKWRGDKTLRDPVANIRIGTAFLNYLRDRFDMHARLYLAAYNMGAKNVKIALDKNVWPKDYPSHVMKFYVEFYNELEELET